MQCPKAVIFDLDETLSPSFTPLRTEIAERLTRLIDRVPVAIMSGAGFDRIERDAIARLPSFSANLAIFPNSSSQCYMYETGVWKAVYSHLLSPDERAEIRTTLEAVQLELPELSTTQAFGSRIVDREAQIAFACIGAEAPANIKGTWDPSGEKRQTIARVLRDRLPHFDILIGGASTIDITRKDTNKSYGVHWYAEYLNTTPPEMLYVGDALYPGGNDEVVIPTGIQTRTVASPDETPSIVDEILAACTA